MRHGPLVVIGDVLLDVDLEGDAARLCPDAPVPVVDCAYERGRAGGAGLAACLAAGFAGGDVVLVTAVGDDPAGHRVSELLAAYADVIPVPMAGTTACKTRVRAAGRTLVRVDRGDGRVTGEPLPERAAEVLRRAGAVLVSDYGRGVAAHAQIGRLLAALPDGVPLVWDPHPHGPPPIGARLVTPNEAEAREFARGRPDPGGGEPFARAAADAAVLVGRWRAAGVAVTLAERGALLSLGEAAPYVALPPDTPTDPRADGCGAGDCFAAAAAHVLHGGGMVTEAVTEAVRRATAFVRAGGVAALGEAPRASAAETGDVWETVRRVRERGGRVVATGGCFDLLHAGHVSLLRAARRLGDCLVVCVNSDPSVRALKGSDRPLVPAADRVRVLAALECVDAVAVFDELTPATLLERLRPDLWVKGGDYSGIDLAEAAVVRRYGGEVVLLPYLDGRSTSRLVARARETAGITPGGENR